MRATNVLNLDPNDADGDADVADGRFSAIAKQIINNLKAPDIIGLQEIQDNTGSADDGVTSASDTLQKLVDEIAAMVVRHIVLSTTPLLVIILAAVNLVVISGLLSSTIQSA
ncbi:MAG: hypothetical protein HC917_24515 [Richelia sp. SM2_1_7]|nr:hypothetical protein [Richelia sp. SM2_1_7]